ncbi:MAG: hypothetical protein JNL74_24235 [Fibrobacteres bacterium]|nr:hypothetical protein [Fibrobacterota bacterium]
MLSATVCYDCALHDSYSESIEHTSEEAPASCECNCHEDETESQEPANEFAPRTLFLFQIFQTVTAVNLSEPEKNILTYRPDIPLSSDLNPDLPNVLRI